MDVNKLLLDLREAVDFYRDTGDNGMVVAAMFEELDVAVSNGGPLPDAWEHGRAIAKREYDRDDWAN